MVNSPLQSALDWWAGQDGMGGFQAAAAALFPGWTAKRACRAPHREDRTPSFSLYRNGRGEWRFKDHATGEQGGLVGFVMLAGMGPADSAKWLMDAVRRNDEIRNSTLGEAEGRGRQTNDEGPMRKFRHSGFVIDSDFVIRHSSFSPWHPYAMSDSELARCAAMTTALATDTTAIQRIAAARGWQPETIRGLALDSCLGLHEGRPVMIYPTGAKKRFKSLDTLGTPDTHDAPLESPAGMDSRPSHSSRSPERSRMGAEQNATEHCAAQDANALIGDSREAIPTSGTNGMAVAPRAISNRAPFIWMFGKPHSLWRGDRLLPCTERVHITEGETAAISLIDEGIGDDTTEIVMAVPGASCWRDEWAAKFAGFT